ncbi:class I SAM-dependent methyltransferase [Sphaerisporangium aureirubrum]|uniref:Class I SAM-dependent methyltransferase n=1 Tax=Sphaerisporangium aureirubrum TaxID=1544736 RepID=A0ABW1NDS5_9ACTN
MAHRHHHHATAEDDGSAMAELLDLDAEIFRPVLTEVIGLIHGLAAGMPVRRILDLGSGTGTGVFALLQRFEDADAIAVDTSAQMLHRVEDRARDLGVARRLRTVEADLDAAWPAVGTVDLVWASASMHHMTDPARVLTDVFAALRPGGLLAMMELDSFPRSLPGDLGIGRPGLEDRCHAALAEAHAAEMPHFHADWSSFLSGAGFTVEVAQTFTVDLPPPLSEHSRRYALAFLRRIRSRVEDRLSAEDLATLDTVIDGDGPDGALRRDDLFVRGTRTALVARRP